MRTMIQSDKELPQFEAVALIERAPNRIECARSQETEETTNRFRLKRLGGSRRQS